MTSIGVAAVLGGALSSCTLASPVPTAAAAGGNLKACEVVSEQLFTEKIGVDPGIAVAQDDQHCGFSSADGSVQVTVQTSANPDVDLPATTYYADPSHRGVEISTGVDRGYYVPPEGSFGSGGFLVVKHGKGALVTIYLSADYTGDGVLALANAVAAQF
jgi:hypothetical protein